MYSQRPSKIKKSIFSEFLDRSKPNYFDKTLLLELRISKAHAKMLMDNKILTSKEYEQVCNHIVELEKDIYLGKISCPSTYHELFFQVHDELFSPLLDVNHKLQIGRSFTDQNVLTLKILIREEVQQLKATILKMQQSILDVSKKYFNSIIPGYNHLQQSVPNLLSNFFMAFYFMLERDYEELKHVEKACSVMPIGVDIGLEHMFSLDRTVLLKELEMTDVSSNNIDAISDRDFAITYHSLLARIMSHLSRLCEELIIWSTAEFAYIDIPQGYSLGTESLPWRKAPDALEMIRGKSSTVFGNLSASLTLYRTLPMGHLADYEDEREILFDSSFIVNKCLCLLERFILDMSFNVQKAFDDVANNYGLSFIIIEYLLQKGATPSEANDILVQIIDYCKNKNVGFESLISAEYKQFSAFFDEDIAGMVSLDKVFTKNETVGLGKITKQEMLKIIENSELHLKDKLENEQGKESD